MRKTTKLSKRQKIEFYECFGTFLGRGKVDKIMWLNIPPAYKHVFLKHVLAKGNNLCF